MAKLVDILARELKAWPEDCTAGYCCQSDHTTKVFFVGPALSIYLSERADQTEGVRVSRKEWQAAVDALNVPAAWNGEGLPPVGTVCEFRVEENDWRQCEVIAHKNDLAVCWIHCNKILSTGGASVRPARTPEQIAAEERASLVKQACADIEVTVAPYNETIECSAAIRATVDAMLEAGYRKQATP